jgi:DNA-binding MarR family transcriptional regulator
MLSMSEVEPRQHVVKERGTRSPAGAALNDVIIQIVQLNRLLTAAAERLTKPAGQTLARWLVLAECGQPATVAEIARRLALSRQGVQRVADALVGRGLCSYAENPHHQRAQLLGLTRGGRDKLARIQSAQRAWCDDLGGSVGEGALRDAERALAPVLEVLREGRHASQPLRTRGTGRVDAGRRAWRSRRRRSWSRKRPWRGASEVVRWLGAVQAQDYSSALWAIGLRLKDAREEDVVDALAKREIVRTWPMRGTLHLVDHQRVASSGLAFSKVRKRQRW